MDKLCSKGTMVGRRLDNIWYFPDIYVSIYVTQYTILSYTAHYCRTRFQIMWIHYIFFFGTTYLVHSTVCKLNIIMEQLFRYIYRYLPARVAANTAIVYSVLWYGLVTHGTLALQNWNRFLYEMIVSHILWLGFCIGKILSLVSTTFLGVLALKGYGKQPFCTTEHTAEAQWNTRPPRVQDY